jgi:uncharacterized protein YegP (UPF0339 family)
MWRHGSARGPARAAFGEAYESKASALNGIDSVRRNAADATLDDQTG